MSTLVAAVLAVTVVAVLVIAFLASPDDPSSMDPVNPPSGPVSQSTSPDTSDAEEPKAPETPETDDPVSDREINALLRGFAVGYRNEDPEAIEGLMAPKVEIYDKRPGRPDPVLEEAVLAWFDQEFAATEVADFRLTRLTEEGSKPGLRRIKATYLITFHNLQPLLGRIRFDVRREDGDPQIAKIVMET